MKFKLKNELILEICLVAVVLGLACLMMQVGSFKMVVLNLFFLPVVIGAFFLGRYRAGILALLSFVMVTIVAAQEFGQFAAISSPITTALAITIWGGVLGLTTILAGTLSDERTEQMTELHEAYIGVIEVFSKYLHSVSPNHKDRPMRIAELSQRIGTKMRLSAKELDDIRVASLLQEMDHIEITARVVRKAVGNLEEDAQHPAQTTFHGSDLVQSLGAVINGALPLLCRYEDDITRSDEDLALSGGSNAPLGAQVIRTARTFDRLVYGNNPGVTNDPVIIVAELKAGMHGAQHPAVLHALEQIVQRPATTDGKPSSPPPSESTLTTPRVPATSA
jgi:hypothetical protein